MGLLQIKTKQICLVQQVNGPSGNKNTCRRALPFILKRGKMANPPT